MIFVAFAPENFVHEFLRPGQEHRYVYIDYGVRMNFLLPSDVNPLPQKDVFSHYHFCFNHFLRALNQYLVDFEMSSLRILMRKDPCECSNGWLPSALISPELITSC